MTGFASKPWWEPVDDFAFPIGTSPAGWTFILGCKFCKYVNHVPSRSYHVLNDSDDPAEYEASRLDMQAFRCDNCGVWLKIRTADPEYYERLGLRVRAEEIMNA